MKTLDGLIKDMHKEQERLFERLTFMITHKFPSEQIVVRALQEQLMEWRFRVEGINDEQKNQSTHDKELLNDFMTFLSEHVTVPENMVETYGNYLMNAQNILSK